MVITKIMKHLSRMSQQKTVDFLRKKLFHLNSLDVPEILFIIGIVRVSLLTFMPIKKLAFCKF